MAYVLPAGSTATIDNSGGSSPTALTGLLTIGGNTATMSMSEVTALSDTELKRLPSRLDPGTVQLTFLLDDTTTASNQLTALKTRQTGKTKSVIAVNLPGSTIDTLLSFTGYISDVTTPEVGTTDEPLTYTVTMQVSAA